MVSQNSPVPSAEVCKEIYDLKEEVLKRVIFQLSPALEPRYLDFLEKYLKACLKLFPISQNGSQVIKVCFLDDRRGIYHWVTLKINSEGKLVKNFEYQAWIKIKNKLAKRIAGVVRHTFKASGTVRKSFRRRSL